MLLLFMAASMADPPPNAMFHDNSPTSQNPSQGKPQLEYISLLSYHTCAYAQCLLSTFLTKPHTPQYATLRNLGFCLCQNVHMTGTRGLQLKQFIKVFGVAHVCIVCHVGHGYRLVTSVVRQETLWAKSRSYFFCGSRRAPNRADAAEKCCDSGCLVGREASEFLRTSSDVVTCFAFQVSAILLQPTGAM